MAESHFPSFRSAAKKTSKANILRNKATGFFTYVCRTCGKPANYNKRQQHLEKVLCRSCREINV